MGDFQNGIDQSNNMLSEMSNYNSQLKEHLQLRHGQLNQVLAGARTERTAQQDPKKLTETASQFYQTGERFGAARGVLKDTYDDNKLSYLSNLGRKGDETGASLVRGVKKLTGMGSVQEVKAATPTPTKQGFTARTADGRVATTAEQQAGFDAESMGHVAPPPRPTLPARPKALASYEASKATTTPAKDISKAASDIEPEAKQTITGTAGELLGKAGIGVGIVGGLTSLGEDMTGGKFHLEGDNKMERAGNALSMGGAALDTLGLVAPPLAILGGLAGIFSAGADLIGHLEHSSKTAGTATAEEAKPTLTAEHVTSIASTGQIASRGTDMLHSINPNGSF